MKNKWNNSYNITTREGDLSCPSCNHRYDEQIIYFFEPNTCPKCKTAIGFISISPYDKTVYIIDLNIAPEVFSVMFDYLSQKSHKEAYNQMKDLIRLFQS